VSPNDLRRTLGYWLRDAGVEPHLIGKVDSRMAEMVHAKGSKAGIRSPLEAQISVRNAVHQSASQTGHAKARKTA
jgi:hypothetical protein